VGCCGSLGGGCSLLGCSSLGLAWPLAQDQGRLGGWTGGRARRGVRGTSNCRSLVGGGDEASVGAPRRRRAAARIAQAPSADGRLAPGPAGFEARGFIFGPPVALALGVPFVMLRKPGKLPGESLLSCWSRFAPGPQCSQQRVRHAVWMGRLAGSPSVTAAVLWSCLISLVGCNWGRQANDRN
jgi:hypothetical protein